jgi:LPXTG-motif cell wall-anchored protein
MPSMPPDGGSGGASGGNQGESLPITGQAIGGLVALGLGLVAAGTALLVVRRRRASPRARQATTATVGSCAVPSDRPAAALAHNLLTTVHLPQGNRPT